MFNFFLNAYKLWKPTISYAKQSDTAYDIKKKECFLFCSCYLLIYGGVAGSYIEGTMRYHTADNLYMPNLIL